MTPPEQPAEIAATVRLDEESLDPSGLVVTVSGELDVATARQLRARLTAAIDAGVNRLAIDLCPLGFLDSIALAVMLRARTRLGDAGRMAVVVAPDSYTRLIFEVAGMPQCIELFETREQAIAYVAG
jgi:anti-anti-sigma factor